MSHVLVTGAGRGIGLAIAKEMAGPDTEVVGTVRDSGRAKQLSADFSGTIKFAPLHLGSDHTDTDIAALVETYSNTGLDVLIHNAGYGIFGPVECIDAQAEIHQFRVNVLDPMRLTRALLPAIRQSRGRIIFIGSLAGRITLPFQGHYSATKSALASLSEALRMELGPDGIQVTCLEPGDFATGFPDARESHLDVGVYTERAKRCLEAVERDERGGADPAQVAKLVRKFCEARKMPVRRAVGPGARSLGWASRLFPETLRLKLTLQHYGIAENRRSLQKRKND
ncbi:MAG: SDR family NAD(P)-dependent oxidoreductase [Myxococcota bacterium]|nr:SDR family NAD(P)-dependent oxidoreductase [Myxococcota bacterium]